MSVEDAIDKFDFLSLSGYLMLQEKRGRLLVHKKGQKRYWFWFDENDCLLKYFKNQETCTQHLHPIGVIDMNNAKVTPAAVHGDSNFDPNTFIITTKDGLYYALTADTDIICHKWIKKLQDKRSEWIKRDTRNINTISTSYLQSLVPKGLVNEIDLGQSPEFSRSPCTQSCLRKMFYEQLKQKGPQSSPTSFGSIAPYSDPFMDVETIEDVDGPEDTIVTSNENPVTLSTSSEDSSNDHQQMSDIERQLMELKCELGETRQERDKYQKMTIHLQELLTKSQLENSKIKDDLENMKETLHKIKSPSMSFVTENENLKSVIENLQRSLKSLDGEVELYKLDLNERDKHIASQKEKIIDLEREHLSFKLKYLALLSQSFKIPIPSPVSDAIEQSDPLEDKLKQDLKKLILDESTADNPLSSDSTFEDEYGEIHDWHNDNNVCHFMCRQLYLHYTENEQESFYHLWYRYLKGLKKVKDRYYVIPTDRIRKRELRNYLRKGIPQQFRSQVWASLIYHHVGKLREIKDSTARGGNYYQTLLTTSEFKKQILLDLYRTIPSNKHFKMGGNGIEKLQRVLVAYSNHNKNIGYCQSMNMIAAIGLLFLDEETAFWYLVAIIEKLMPPFYYSHGLAAARADQVVFPNLVREKLTVLNEHLESNYCDVTIISVNWFLTLFINALPTESMLRIMDCFLLEGRKLLFRFSLAILKLYETRILSITDPVSIFQFIKELPMYIFNVEDLVRIAFVELNPFPSRSQLTSQCQPHTEVFKEEWMERERLKILSREEASKRQPLPAVNMTSSLRNKQKKQLQWESACILNEGEVWLCCCERQIGKLCIVSAGQHGFDTSSPQLNVGSRVLCIKSLSNDIVMMGTLDFSLHAVCSKTKKELWSMKMSDSILDFIGVEDTLLCALADGYIGVLPTNGRYPPTSDPLLYRIGNTAVQCMVHTPYQHIWCGCGKAITIISAITHEPVKPLVMSDNAGRVYKMELGHHGIWVTFRSSTVISLYDTKHMIQLLQIDYTQILGQLITADHRIIVMTPINDQLWIGTGNATIHIFSVASVVSSPSDSILQIVQKTQEDRETFERSIQHHQIGGNEGLVRPDPNTLPSSPVHSSEKTLDGTIDKIIQHGRRKRNTFGKTFRTKRDLPQDAANTEDGSIYKLVHLTSSRVLPESQEGSRVTILKPIKHNDHQFVISCVNSTNIVEKAVQLWQCSATSPTNWSYTSIPECYECVIKDITSPTPSLSPERGQTYSAVFGALPPTESNT